MSDKMRGGPEDPNKTKKEIEEGIAEYKEGVAKFAGEQAEYKENVPGEQAEYEEERERYEEEGERWKKETREVNPAESKKHLEHGLEKAREIITGVKGDFIGAHFVTDSDRWRTDLIETLDNVGEEEILRKLALGGVGGDWRPLYDDKFVHSGQELPSDVIHRYSVGNKEICFSKYQDSWQTEPFYYVAGEEVTPEDFEACIEGVKKMLVENYEQRGVHGAHRRQLPPEVEGKVKMMRFDHRTEQVLEEGQVVQAGTIHLKHGPYGSSYFGSGGGYGSVNAYDLVAWREGKRVKKGVATKDGDNGFMSGPNEATIEPGTILICKGGDAIGSEGRSWEEIYICE